MLQTKYKSFENIYQNPNLLVSLVFSFFPISFVFGSFVVNLNLVLFCLLGIYYLKSKILKTEYDFSIKIIFLFFIIIFISTVLSYAKTIYIEGYDDISFVRLTKSILFFRYFLLLITIYLLNKFNILDFKYFFLTAALSATVVSLDVIYQFFMGANILGQKSSGFYNSGFFGDEIIAGGYIQRFSFFSIFFITLLFNNRKYTKFIFSIALISILIIGIFFAGNRMPLILFIAGLFLIFLLNIKIKKIIFLSILATFLILQFIILSNDSYKTHLKNAYYSFYVNSMNVVANMYASQKWKITRNDIIVKGYEEGESRKSITRFYEVKYETHYKRLFLTAIDVWSKNKIFGNGIKSFRLDCYNLQGRDLLDENATYEYNLTEEYMANKKNRLCSNHPHNYYFEILTEIGLLGLFVTLIIASLFITFIVKNFQLLKEHNIESSILLAAVISLFLEVFPIKSSGSLFSTNDAAYITLIASIILSYKKKLTKVIN